MLASLFLSWQQDRLLACIHAVGTTKRDSAASYSWRPPRRIGRIKHTTTNLAGVLNPPIIATSVCLDVSPQATELTLDFAASVGTAWRIASETKAISKATPTRSFEQL